MANQQQLAVEGREQLSLHFLRTRERSVAICAPLSTEDYVIQTMPDVSPPKWHLAHTSWFYEAFLLSQFDANYQCFHPLFDTLFNSYYVTHGNPYPRPQRGLLSRPTVEEVLEYRRYVDEAVQQLIVGASEAQWQQVLSLIILGINHEQQHQELLLTDIKHIFAHNPLSPVYRELASVPREVVQPSPLSWQTLKGGLLEFGIAETSHSFSYDNEGPAHKAYLEDFKLASRLVTNKEYMNFIEDGGYQRAELWLSDGWTICQQQAWQAPLYWQLQDDAWLNFTFEGLQEIEWHAPLCHVSYFEADAYATWAGRRLPTEYEWESAAHELTVSGNLFDEQQLKPVVSTNDQSINQMFGDVWEWTASPYVAYPEYKPAQGSIGEYNGKFMSSQMVLKGGSFATANGHIRASYRNFFYPKDRWQFSGIRLADEA